MKRIVNVHEAKTHLSRLLESVRRGEEIVIGKGGRPVARLVPIEQARARRTPGSGRGLFRMTRSFDASAAGPGKRGSALPHGAVCPGARRP